MSAGKPSATTSGRSSRPTKQAAELTHQLLAFARQEMVQPRALNINDAVLSVEQLLIRTLGEHVELITDLAADLRPVLADPGQIEQVLVNLAVNARDAMPQGGKLIIRTASTSTDDTASQGELPPGRYVALKVSDTGTGIAKDVLDRVFEPFFTTKPKGEGTGLGLATVYGIITQAGGHVWIYSEPGLGTSLTALLPITEQDIALASPPPAEPPHGHGQTVLVVEDAPAMREVTRRILDRSGYHVVAAASGHEALDVLAGQLEHIDVLLTDVIMPRMQGKELADKVRVMQPAVPGGIHVRLHPGPARRARRPGTRSPPHRETLLRKHPPHQTARSPACSQLTARNQPATAYAPRPRHQSAPGRPARPSAGHDRA